MTSSKVTSAPLERVHVYQPGRRVGTLAGSRGGGGVSFTYDPAVLGEPTAAVSARLPVRAAPYAEHDTVACFENLLPDGDLRNLLAVGVKLSAEDVVGLLGVFGGECAGALSFWPEGTDPPDTPTYRPCTAADVHAAFAPATLVTAATFAATAIRADAAEGMVSPGLTRLLTAARLSMSGAQEKLALYRMPPIGNAPNGSSPEYLLPVNGAPSTVMVKRERARFPGLLQNELACMTMMAAAGVPTAAHTVCALDAGAYETARFDRLVSADGTVTRAYAEDGCQLTGKRPGAKYAQTGGPSYAELVAALRRYTAEPGKDAVLLFRWAVANLALGNRDAHAKNVSLVGEVPTVLQLAPAYDVICTMAYAELDTALPLVFGGALQLTALHPSALAKAARAFGLTSRLAHELVADVCDRLDAARDDALQTATRVAGPHDVLNAVDVVVQAMTAETRTRLLG